MIAQHDIKGDGVLNFEEFECIFFDRKSLPDKETPFGKEGPQIDKEDRWERAWERNVEWNSKAVSCGQHSILLPE